MREMRRKAREIKSSAIIREILEECRVVRIGAADREGMFIVPVNFGYDFSVRNEAWDLKLYIHGAMEGRKAEAFGASSEVALEMDCRHRLITGENACSCSFSYRSIMGNGKIRRLDRSEEKAYALERIMEHTAPEAAKEFQPGVLEHTAVYCIEVRYFSGKERT